MKYMKTNALVHIPDGVSVKVRSRVVTVKGPRGEIVKNFKHLPLDLNVVDSKKFVGKKDVSITMWFGGYRLKPRVKTCGGLIKNMITGVTRGFRYKMRCVNAHFPIKIFIADDNKSVEFRNFLGGAQAKTIVMKPSCTITLNPKMKDEIIVDGIDVDYVAQTCALINQCVNVGNKDVRKFLDGIYVSEKTFQDIDQE